MTQTAEFRAVIVREWFDRTYGNTYHSVRATLTLADGTNIETVAPFAYGHGPEQAARTVLTMLAAEGFTVSTEWPNLRGALVDVAEVARRKDLHAAGRRSNAWMQVNGRFVRIHLNPLTTTTESRNRQ